MNVGHMFTNDQKAVMEKLVTKNDLWINSIKNLSNTNREAATNTVTIQAGQASTARNVQATAIDTQAAAKAQTSTTQLVELNTTSKHPNP